MTNILKWFPSFLLVLVTIAWGTTFFIVKETVAHVNPYNLVFIRCIIAALPLLAIVAWQAPRKLLNWPTLRGGLVLGFLLAAIYTTQTLGLQYTSAGHSAFITGISIVLVPVVLFFWAKQRFTQQNILAIILVTIGLFLLTFDIDTPVNRGDLITLLTALSGALQISVTGTLVRKLNVMALVGYQFLFAALLNFVIVLSQDQVQFAYPTSVWSSLLYLAFVGTLFCYWASSWAQKNVNIVMAALIFSLEPVFASIFSYFFAGEELTRREYIGACIILIGILYYELPVRKLIRKFKYRHNRSN